MASFLGPAEWVGASGSSLPSCSPTRAARSVRRTWYATLRAEEVPRLLAEVPAEWRPLFAAALWTGMRRGELFALRKYDVNLALGTITVQRSHQRDTTKGGHADLIPIAAPLLRISSTRSPSPFILSLQLQRTYFRIWQNTRMRVIRGALTLPRTPIFLREG